MILEEFLLWDRCLGILPLPKDIKAWTVLKLGVIAFVLCLGCCICVVHTYFLPGQFSYTNINILSISLTIGSEMPGEGIAGANSNSFRHTSTKKLKMTPFVKE